MTIDEIYNKKEISIRSYHVCKYNGLDSVLDLKNYYFKNKSFEKLRRCGRKSNEELINICNNIQVYYSKNTENELEKRNPLREIITSLTRIQREIINNFISVNSNNLSVRSRNALSLYLKSNLKIKNFAEEILLFENFKINNIKNIGAKYIPELEVFISNVKDFILKVSETDDEKRLIALKTKFLIQKTFSISIIPNEILESESIFSLTNFLLNQNAFFDEIQTIIVKKTLKINENQKELTLDAVAKEVGLTRERVRQIRKICLDELFNKLLFIQSFNDDLFQKYSIDTSSNFIDVDIDMVERINTSSNTSFTREFVMYILYVYLNKSFTLIGNYEDLLQPKYFNVRNRHNWNNFYLVKSEIAFEFNFRAFVDDISNRLRNKIEESYSFNFKSYLSKFLTNNNIGILDQIFQIGEKIINDEFEIYLDLNEDIFFYRNTNKQTHEYAYEALEKLGKPSKVKEIFEKVRELNPNYDTEEEKIRVSMRRKKGFIPIGRNSIFGLKKWEDELKNFKDGTIRNIAEEYLSTFSMPKHISDITEYVLKYRPKSNQYSILQNLKLDESGLYVFFKNSYVGLSTKKYNEHLQKIIKEERIQNKTWEDSFEMLLNFIEVEKRFPFSHGVPENEIKLYRWLNVQKNRQSKGKLDKDKTEHIKRLLDKYQIISE